MGKTGKGRSVLSIMMGMLVLSTPLTTALAAFQDASSWDTFDIQSNAIGTQNTGFTGAIFDGTYMYMVPSRSPGGNPHGEVVRYDTREDFSLPSSWEAYDPGSNGVGIDPDGFRGGVFDGRYIYMPPFNTNTSGASGEILRFDTQGGFTTPASWTTFDTEAQNSNAEGYLGAVYDGRYVYFIGWRQDSGFNSLVARFDTQDPDGFTDTASWQYYEHNLGLGYDKAIFDGRYIYFIPFDDGNGNGTFARYDTQGGFTNPASWTGFDPSNLIGNDTEGFRGGAYDGRYIYFAPGMNTPSNTHGQVLRFDTEATFNDINSWEVFDAAGIGPETDGGYNGAIFDGQYVIFMPGDNSFTGEVLRYNTAGNFTNEDSWDSYDPLGATPRGFYDGGWDGDYIYISPYQGNPGQFIGEVLRYRTEVGKDLHGRVTLSNTATNATDVQYNFSITPITPFDDQSQIVLTFPDEYDTEFDGLVSGDIAVSGAGVSSSVVSFDYDANELIVTLSTFNGGENEIVTPVLITVGDGAAGGLNDLTNPAAPGGYGIGIDATTSGGELLYQDYALAYVENAVNVMILVAEALIMTLDGNKVSIVADPSVNDGQDLSQQTEITVSSNAANGYVIQAYLDDGNGNAQLTNNNGGAIPSDLGAGENYFSYAARNDGTGVQTGAEQDFQSTPQPLLDNLGDPVGMLSTALNQPHTINYELNVDYLPPAGRYTGTLYYTVVAQF